MKRKTTLTYEAGVHYQACPVKHVDARLRKLARDWGGKKTGAEYEKRFDLRTLSFTFPTKMQRYRFLRKVQTYLREIEGGLSGFVFYA